MAGHNRNLTDISGKFIVQGKTKHVSFADTVFSQWDGIDWRVAVWFAGMIITLSYFGCRYVKEYRRIRIALPVSNDIEENLGHWCIFQSE